MRSTLGRVGVGVSKQHGGGKGNFNRTVSVTQLTQDKTDTG